MQWLRARVRDVHRRTTPILARIRAVIHLLVRLGGGLLYALPVEAVREVVPYATPRTLPSDAAHVLGVVSVRGAIVTLHDVAVLLGARRTETPTLVAILDDHGVVVERVEGLRELAPTTRAGRRRGAIVVGIAADGDDVVEVLDAKALLRVLAPPPPPRRRRRAVS